MNARGRSFAVVGHVEWVQFARVAHVPRAGEVAHASDVFEEPAGGGGVAAVQLARLAGSSRLFTTLGADEQGRGSLRRLRELGVRVSVRTLDAPTRRAITLVDDAGERTITTFGPRLEPCGGEDGAQWEGLGDFDAVYFTAGDLEALRLAREHARVLVASPRARAALGHGVPLDALVLSGDDPVELDALAPARGEARLLCFTEGERGGRYELAGEGEGEGRWAAVRPPGATRDTYGCGDSFAAGLAYALANAMAPAEALALAARCGAWCAAGAGPYERQLTAAELHGGA